MLLFALPENGLLDASPGDVIVFNNHLRRISALLRSANRPRPAEKRAIRTDATHIGFFGNHPFAYKDLVAGRDLGVLSETLLPCDCTE